MDERQWLASTDPEPMLKYLHGKISTRKLRLFAAACCRSVWELLLDPASRKAVEVAELAAEGRVKRPEQRAAFQAANRVARSLLNAGYQVVEVPGSALAATAAAAAVAAGLTFEHTDGLTRYHAWDSVVLAEGYRAQIAARQNYPPRAEDSQGWDEEWWERRERAAQAADHVALATTQQAQCLFLRDIIGNPFRDQPIEPAWRTRTVLALAQTTYEHRLLPSGHLNLERLAVLADALEEAGADTELVDHLRGPGPHVRGCHVIDRITART